MTAHTPQPNRQTLYVAIALALGILVGELLSLTVGGTETLKQIVGIFSALTDIFHSGGGHGQNGRYSYRRAGRHQGDAMVFLGFYFQPVAGHAAGECV